MKKNLFKKIYWNSVRTVKVYGVCTVAHFLTLHSQLSMIDAPLQAGAAKNIGLPLPPDSSQGLPHLPKRNTLPVFLIPAPQLHVVKVKPWVSTAERSEAPFLHQLPFIEWKFYPRCFSQRILEPWLPSPQLTCKVKVPRWERQAKETRCYSPHTVLCP